MAHWSFVSLVIVGVFKCVTASESLYDNNLYESVLDNVTCQRHLEEMDFFQFFDASGRIPQSITLGGQGSLGNYGQCLSIAQQLPNDIIWGKYCMIRVILMQSGLNPPVNPAPGTNPELNGTLFELINTNENNADAMWNGLMFKNAVGIMTGNGNTRVGNAYVTPLDLRAFIGGGVPLSSGGPYAFLPPSLYKKSNEFEAMPSSQGGLTTSVAVCLPRSCTTRQVFGQFTDMLNVSYNDLYCRLPDDKIFSTVDYVAVATIVILVILTALSTTYDLYNKFLLEKASGESSKLLTCFSIFTNTRRLLTFSNTPGSIECLDGLRSLAILWVVIGHSFANIFLASTVVNLLTAFQWASSSKSIWLVSAVLSVDTFFMMSGLLIVYTTVNKLTPISLVKNIHLFYLHRLLRMFPLLAAVVLFQASLLHHSADGPGWPALASSISRCRDWWWAALLHVQNYVNVSEICLAHTWYLSVDTQLHVISPLVLFWVLHGRRPAWLGLTSGLLVSIVITTTYCYVKNFPGVSLLSSGTDISKYFKYYYVNTLTRAPAFFVGMGFGYLLHVWRETPKRIPKWFVAAGWLAAAVLGSGIIYCNNAAVKINPFWSNFLNSSMRGLWALAVGWVVFACAQGYGGPINWFLSLKIWKFLARISYSLYLIHYPLQSIIRAQSDMPLIFSVRSLIYLFYTDITLSLMAATALCVLVDAPFSTLQKILLTGKMKPVAPQSQPSNGVSSSTQVLVTKE